MKSESISGAIFPRSFIRTYLTAVRAEGVYIYDDQGNRYLDACGGSAVVTIGHGVHEVIEKIREQAIRISYAHTSQFHTRVAAELAEFLAAKFPGSAPAVRVHFTSGGSEATETAIKIVRQYWIARGQPSRYKILSRWQSYHGATLGALALSGNPRRRKPYEPLLPQNHHISACFCYRCPLSLRYPSCELACARELEQAIANVEKETVAGFILEPIVGTTSGAVPPDRYLQLIREICDEYDILLVADEIMTGSGRTGKYFAVEHWDVVPDIILLGKGLSSGYAPLGAVLVSQKVWRAIRDHSGTLEHGFTYQAHPPSLAAGLAVQRYIEKRGLVDRARDCGEYLARRLDSLRALPCVGDVRGKGLLQTIEFVTDRARRIPFRAELAFADRLFEALRARGILVYPIRGVVDGNSGDHILIAPPFVIEKESIDFLVSEIEGALRQVVGEVQQQPL